jgi:hypothetical protein
MQAFGHRPSCPGHKQKRYRRLLRGVAFVQRVPVGGALSAFSLLPQQATVPSVLTPQVWENPALTWVNVPAGTVLSPELLLLQQTTDPPTLTPHV